MSSKDWIKIYSTTAEYKAEIIKAVFRENNLECIDINKMDSAYGVFGEIEIYTLREKAVRALHILNKQKL